MHGPPADLRPRDDREILFLLDCARATIEPETADRMRARVTAGLNWDRLVALAQRHGLAPLLYAHLSQVCATQVPADTLAFLRDYSQKNTAFVTLLTGELVRVLKLLEANGITAIPYKGPAIGLKLYGSIARRQYGDLDILVRQRDVWEAGRVIESAGFEPVLPVPYTMRARLLRRAYVSMFHSHTSRTLVELHWHIAEPHWAIRFDTDAIWERLEPLALPGVTAWVPCAEDLLLLLCVHGGRHGWEKLEGIGGIAELLRRTPELDWDRVWRQSGEMHCRRLLVFGLLVARGLFDDVPVPPQAAALSQLPELRSLAGTVVRPLFGAGSPSRTSRGQVSYQLRLMESRADRARYFSRVMASTPDDWAMLRLPEPLSFVYPLVRAVRLARKKVYN